MSIYVFYIIEHINTHYNSVKSAIIWEVRPKMAVKK